MGLFDKKGAGVKPASIPSGPDDPGASPDVAEDEIRIPAALFDGLVCGTLLVLGLWFVVGALRLPTSNAAFDPGTFPMITGSLLILLSAIQIGLTVSSRGARGDVVFQRPVWLGIGMVLIVAFPFAVEAFGYYIVAVIWVPIFGVVAGIRRPLSLVVTTAVVLLLAKGVFEMLLGTPLP
ncbi:tripartite tricarboxylate transporter TctB family protein [Pseudotabrizicola algicola]|uniref:Tripartite tricarboxylate transporter TctB family protein n=1 Tax=Pseudotabrizicola algicola TaxID=2709381 RepID=A0A6B3RXK9_9RHOB|nr:tripartite tricarboxylate transporter TctB family protein [Pseudotabrizicola algicola]NEX48615.1 tripartite tricarboxylate transporter TctB family protein [Pseudotabrizicola algicola]